MIPVNEPLLDGNEKDYLLECIETGWISSEGPFVKRFETEFATRCQREHGVAVANGTAALDIAIAALNLGAGDEIILPTFTIISCVHQIIRCGATPVLVDSDSLTWNMDVSQVAAAITDRTKAIMAVHIYGLPVDMDPLMELANEHGLHVVEDAAEMIGQTYRGKPCGSFGDISTFSFYPNKLVTTGEGGMLLTNNPALAKAGRDLRNLCFQPEKRFVHQSLGWNYRMTNLQAALGVAQLEQLDRFVIKKREMGALYTKLLSNIPGIELPLVKTDYAENIYWVYGLVLPDDAPFSAQEAMRRLAEKKIGTRPFFYPMHKQPVLLEQGLFEGTELPVSERLAEQGFYIPSGLALTSDQQFEVAEAIREICTA